MKVIYVVGVAGVLSGPEVLKEIPGIGYQKPENAVELPAVLEVPAEGFAWALVSGKAVQVPDHRGIVYRTEDGSAQEHFEVGNLPAGLTWKAWPGLFHVWGDDDWVLDTTAQLEAIKATERVWRNAQIAATDYLVFPDYPISSAQRAELYTYRQQLRDWPAAGPFPGSSDRPSAPNWIADLPT